LRGIKGEIEAAGARLVFIGNGSTAFARHFKETMVPECEVLTDPSTASYALLGARRGIWTTLTPRSWPASLRALRAGFRQSRTRGHALLQGGLAIVDSSGVVKWRYVSRFAGDHPSTVEIGAALSRALGKPGAAKRERAGSSP
jgi:AhpC/TSA antioxidant enzyme